MILWNFSNWWDKLGNGDQATWLLAVLTFLYFGATVALWITAKKTLIESTKLFAILNTAWIDVMDVEFYTGEFARVNNIIGFKYKNFGTIPAQIIDSELEIKMDGKLLSSIPVQPIDDLLVPNHEKEFEVHFTTDELNEYYQRQFDRVQLTFCLEILYKDASNEIKIFKCNKIYDNNKGKFIDTRAVKPPEL